MKKLLKNGDQPVSKDFVLKLFIPLFIAILGVYSFMLHVALGVGDDIEEAKEKCEEKYVAKEVFQQNQELLTEVRNDIKDLLAQ